MTLRFPALSRALPLFLCVLAGAAGAFADPPRPSTFSIVAADPATGEVGLAVASRFFAVGQCRPLPKGGHRRGRDAGLGRHVVRPARTRAPGARRATGRDRGDPPARRREREPETVRNRRGRREIVQLHRKRLRAVGRRAERAELRGPGKHPGGRAGRRRDGGGLPAREGNAGRPDVRRAPRGRREGRGLAREAVGVASDLEGEGELLGGVDDRAIDIRVDDHADPFGELGRLVEPRAGQRSVESRLGGVPRRPTRRGPEVAGDDPRPGRGDPWPGHLLPRSSTTPPSSASRTATSREPAPPSPARWP